MHHKNETEIHKVNDPCSDDYIPTMSCLLRWQSELRNTSMAIGKFSCEFWLAGEQCRYDLEAILIAQKLHKAREIKQAVEKELTYLFSPRMKPVSITKDIDYNALEKFIELIHNTPYLPKLGSFDMLPEELACLCGRRYLSDEHISWVIQKLNSMMMMFYVFMETLLLTLSASVKDKWNQVNIKNYFLFSTLDTPKLRDKMALS